MSPDVAVVGSLSLDRVNGSRPRRRRLSLLAARALRVFGAQAVIVAKSPPGTGRCSCRRSSASACRCSGAT